MPPTSSSSTAAQAMGLLPKLSDADSDIRYMSLNDLYECLNAGAPSSLSGDYHTSAKIIDGIIQTLDDQNGEVQNQAIRCVGALVLKLPLEILAPFVHRVSDIKITNSVDTSIVATALRTFIIAFPRPLPNIASSQKTHDAYVAISKVLIPRLLGYVVISQPQENLPAPPPGMLELGTSKGANSDALDIMIEIIRCFGIMLDDREKQALQKTIIEILSDDRTSSLIKKKAVLAISALAANLPDRLLKNLVSNITDGFRSSQATLPKRRLLLSVVGSLAGSIPQRIGPYLKSLAPIVLTSLSEKEFEQYEDDAAEDGTINSEVEEVREAGLVALEGFLSSCSNEMRPFTNEAIESSLRYLSYDPMRTSNEDDEEMGGTQEDDEEGEEDFDEEQDYEEEGALSDDDDSSWKVRRCAAKSLYAIILTRSNGDLLENGTLYDKIAPVLVRRFSEREENVRLEIIATLASLVRKTGEGLSPAGPHATPEIQITPDFSQPSRKRRRVDSNVGTFDASSAFSSINGLQSPAISPSPVSGPKADLARLSPTIVTNVATLLKQSSFATKQAAINLLRDLVLVHNGGLSDTFEEVVGPLLDAVKGTAASGGGSASIPIGGAAAAMGSRMRIEAMQLVSAVCDTHSSNVLSPYLDSIVPSVVEAVHDSYYKVSKEALITLESIIKMLTPPRSAGSDQQRKTYLASIYASIIRRSTPSDADLEVRRQALHVLAVLLARTSNSKLMAAADRSKALELLFERLKNETTRLSAARAIDLVAGSAASKSDLDALWVRGVTLELGAQLRKADRTLRGASLSALRSLVSNPIALDSEDDDTIAGLTGMLLPLLASADLSLMGLAMTCLGKLVKQSPGTVIDDRLTSALCAVILTPLGGTVFDAFLALVEMIGGKGVGQTLMEGFLQQVGVSGDPAIVGKAIGTLLISGQKTVGVDLNAFTNELATSKDPQRKCLALSVLGEAGLRLGSSSPLQPEMFVTHFSAKSDVVPRAAAIALGRAGAGNINTFLPIILSNIGKGGDMQYLSLNSIREILQYSGNNRSDISPYTKEIWDQLLAASQLEDNKVIGAECIGRIAIIEPNKYLPLLQDYLKNPAPSVRGMAIQAIRFTFADNDDTFDETLKHILPEMLETMLKDANIENRRGALSTLNSATHNKPETILPQLGNLILLVMKETKINPDLIRQVQMGPFKHQVDDGLELRKSSYETLYSFIETAYSRMNRMDLFDRVIAGLEDEHEIKMLCNLMVTKLAVLDSEETLKRLDSIADKYRAVLSSKPKENAVKQELEKASEASKAALKVTARLHAIFPQASSVTASVQQGQTWKNYWEWVSKDFKAGLTAVEQDMRNETS